ncbi:MAG: glycosyltransferase family 2 protein [Alphaproteobacteria bacterium]
MIKNPLSTKPVVSVIMPNFNHGNFIAMAIESILKQTFQNFELIIIDDGSTDNSLSVIKQYMKQDKRIRLYQQTNQGVAAARNQGLGLASGKYIVWQDADDFSHPDRLKIQYNFLEKNKHIGGAVACYDAVNQNNRTLDNKFYDLQKIFRQKIMANDISIIYDKNRHSLYLKKSFKLFYANMMARKKCYDQMGIHRNLQFGEDKDMFWRLQEKFQLVELGCATPLYFLRSHHDRSKQRLRKKFYGQYHIWLGHFFISLACYARRVYGNDPLNKIPKEKSIARLWHIVYFLPYPLVFYYYIKNKFSK